MRVGRDDVDIRPIQCIEQKKKRDAILVFWIELVAFGGSDIDAYQQT